MKKPLITLSLAAMPNKLFSSTLRLICLALLISGCSLNSSDEVVSDNKPQGILGSMQGSWEPITTNDYTVTSGVIVQDDTIRIRYQGSPELTMERHSAMIDRIDESGQLLIINGGVGAWPYFYGIQDGQEHLEIEFYSRAEEAWHRLHLKRSV
jgi:hypothetical protein